MSVVAYIATLRITDNEFIYQEWGAQTRNNANFFKYKIGHKVWKVQIEVGLSAKSLSMPCCMLIQLEAKPIIEKKTYLGTRIHKTRINVFILHLANPGSVPIMVYSPSNTEMIRVQNARSKP